MLRTVIRDCESKEMHDAYSLYFIALEKTNKYCSSYLGHKPHQQLRIVSFLFRKKGK